MASSDSRHGLPGLMHSSLSVASFCLTASPAPRRVSQVPGQYLSHALRPHNPGEPSRCFRPLLPLKCQTSPSTAVSSLALRFNGAIPALLSLRLVCSVPGYPSQPVARLQGRFPSCRTVNSHGKFLPYRTGQAFLGVTVARRAKTDMRTLWIVLSARGGPASGMALRAKRPCLTGTAVGRPAHAVVWDSWLAE